MKRLRFVVVMWLLAAILTCAASEAALANILIQIDKPTQTMTVSVNGQVHYRWRVSTGATGFSTPVGSYTPFRMEVMHYSQEWDNAGMPHAIFFTIPASARRCPTVASVSRCQTRPRSISSSRLRGWGTPRSS
jgi:hypothetical protein